MISGKLKKGAVSDPETRRSEWTAAMNASLQKSRQVLKECEEMESREMGQLLK